MTSLKKRCIIIRLKEEETLLTDGKCSFGSILFLGILCQILYYSGCFLLSDPFLCYFSKAYALVKKIIERYKTIKKEHQINAEIRDREVRLIGETGEQLGIVSSREALRIAEDAGLDLVKISPNATPPVCKVMNYGKFLFEQNKKAKEAKKNQKVVEVKEVWLSMTIDTGDLNVKAKQAQKFLSAGNKVKVSIRMRGRQQAHPELCMDVMKRFYEVVKDYGVMEKQPLTEGRNIWMMLAPAKA